MSRKPVSVSQVNSYLARLIAADSVLSDIAVTGEVSNLTEHRSGHVYFSLKDALAQVRAVMFRLNNRALKFIPQNGNHVIIVTAQVSLYEARGDYQLLVSQMELAGDGILHKKFWN